MRVSIVATIVALALCSAAHAAASPDSLTFTMPDSVRLDGACDSVNVWAEGDRLSAVVRRLRHDETAWSTVDSLTGLLPSQGVVWRFDAAGCYPCAYQVFVYDSTGNSDQCGSRIVNRWDGGAPVGVEPPPALELPLKPETFDLAGRRIEPGARSGIQFTRTGKRAKKRVVVK